MLTPPPQGPTAHPPKQVFPSLKPLAASQPPHANSPEPPPPCYPASPAHHRDKTATCNPGHLPLSCCLCTSQQRVPPSAHPVLSVSQRALDSTHKTPHQNDPCSLPPLPGRELTPLRLSLTLPGRGAHGTRLPFSHPPVRRLPQTSVLGSLSSATITPALPREDLPHSKPLPAALLHTSLHTHTHTVLETPPSRGSAPLEFCLP